jgi:hypothetical protein
MGERARDVVGDADAEGESDEESPLAALAVGGVTFVTLAVAFGLLAAGVEFFWIAFPIGFAGGMPLAIGVARWYESRRTERERGGASVGRRSTEREETDAALADLRERYARGELDDAEFEARVDRLLETESVEDATEFAERRADDAPDSAAGVGDGTAADDATSDGENERERA